MTIKVNKFFVNNFLIECSTDRINAINMILECLYVSFYIGFLVGLFCWLMVFMQK